MIKLDHVTKIFSTEKGKAVAVNDLSLEIGEGEFCIFLGPSGCGKTTSLKMINRLIPLTSGHIYVDGADTLQMNENELRRGIGYAIQGIGLFPHFTVAENIATVPELRHWPKQKRLDRAAELLDLVGLDPATYLNRYPSELSGGQQQRVGVARCLGADPPILLMDEPFGAIDPITRSRLQDEFLNIQAKLKKTIVFVTHDLEEAIKMGDRIALMREGSLVQYSAPADLLYSPNSEFVRDFVGADRILRGMRLHRVSEMMQQPKAKLTINTSAAEARQFMQKENQRWAVIVDGQDRLQGWVTWEDLKEQSDLSSIIQPPVVTADPTTPLNEALSMMLHSAVGTLAVTDDRNRLLGLVVFGTIRDELSKFITDDDQIPAETSGVQGSES